MAAKQQQTLALLVMCHKIEYWATPNVSVLIDILRKLMTQSANVI